MSDWYTASGWPATNAPGASSPARAEFLLIQAAMAKLPAISGATAGAAVVINGSGTALTTTAGALALAGNLATTGAFNTTFAQGANVTLTLPLVNGTLATLAGTESLTNKTISGASNTLSNIGNSSLTNSSITIGSTAVSLGGTAATIAGVALTASSLNGLTVTTTTGTLTLANGKTFTVSNGLTLAGTDGTVMTFPSTSATLARTDAAQTFAGVQSFSTGVAAAQHGPQGFAAWTPGSSNVANSGNPCTSGTAYPLFATPRDGTYVVRAGSGTNVTAAAIIVAYGNSGNSAQVVWQSNTNNITFSVTTGNTVNATQSSGLAQNIGWQVSPLA